MHAEVEMTEVEEVENEEGELNIRRTIFSESGVFKTWTDDIGKLFKDFQKEYGKCTGHVYIDDKPGMIQNVLSHKIGWVFKKTAYYEDTHDPFTQETWVTLHKKEPSTTVTHYHHYLD